MGSTSTGLGSQTLRPRLRWCREESGTSISVLQWASSSRAALMLSLGLTCAAWHSPGDWDFHIPRFVAQLPFEPSKRVLLKSSQSKDISHWVLAGDLKPQVMVAAGQMWASKIITARSRKFWIFNDFLWTEQVKIGKLDLTVWSGKAWP